MPGTPRKTRAERYTEKTGKRPPPPEIEIVKQIERWAARRHDLTLWRLNTGAASLPGKGGRARPVFFGKKGQPDLIGFLAPAGRFVGIEVKRPAPFGAKLTAEQKHLGTLITRAGGIWFVATSVDDTIRQLETARQAEKETPQCTRTNEAETPRDSPPHPPRSAEATSGSD